MEHKGKKWERIDEEDPGSESGQKKPRGVHGHLTKPKLFTRIKGLWRRPHGKTGPETDILLQETKIDLQKLIMEGRFLEACQSIASSGHMEGQDCGPQFQAVAERMWQVVKQALEHHGPHRELEPQLESVVAAVAWAQSNPQTPETSDLQASGVATWGSQLEKLLRRDAEARIPTPDPHDQLSPYLGKLEKAVEQSLGSGRVEQLGPSLWVRYRACFQDVLVSNLSELIRFCSNEWTRASELYKWSKKILFEKWGEKLQNVPPTSRASQAGSLLDLLVFVTWMSQLQEKLVELIQNKVENAFEKVLSCDTRQWAKSPCPTFLEIFELLEAPMRECQDLEQPITSRVQDKVMEIFSKFLQRYPEEAERFLSMRWGPGTFPELHVLENCCVLRKTWCELTQVHGPQDDLERAAQGAIDGVEQVGQDHLLQGVIAQCQSLLQDHFGRKDNKLVSALRSLCQGLEGRPNMHPSPTYKSLVWSLHKAVIGEYVQALAVHLRELAPEESGALRNQVDTDILMLNKVFRRLEQCPESLAESRPLTMAHQSPDLDEMQGHIMGVLQPGECLSPDRVDRWLTDFNQKFPGYLRQDPKVKEGARSCWSCLCCCC
ncbi:uncharacterized protein LOC111750191 isoform X3 [Loxodonta africana]|uniref:uncharacterized protein LOC111750191 isoform X3 n=1 Tax=Loxodonta africana TaxID=9785 RepID=UPI0030CFE47E